MTVPPLNQDQFAHDVLVGLGVKNPSRTQMAILVGWFKLEGGHYNGRLYNPLNSIWQKPGSTSGGSQGNIQSYPNYATGVQATVDTLKQSYYVKMVAALKKGLPETFVHELILSPWEAGHYAGSTTGLRNAILNAVHNAGSHPSSEELKGGTDATGAQDFAASKAGGVVADALGVAAAPVKGIQTVAGFLGELSVHIFDPKWWARIGLFAAGILLMGFGIVMVARDFAR